MRPEMLRWLDRVEKTDYVGRLTEYLLWSSSRDLVPDWPFDAWGSPLPEDQPAETTFRESAPQQLETRLCELLHFRPWVNDDEAVEPLHQMRIAAKWLRYTQELFGDAYEDGLKVPIATIKRVQEQLGDLHDADVRGDLIAECRQSGPEVEALVEAGMLTADALSDALDRLQISEALVRRENLERFQRDWNKLERRGYFEELALVMSRPNAPATLTSVTSPPNTGRARAAKEPSHE